MATASATESDSTPLLGGSGLGVSAALLPADPPVTDPAVTSLASLLSLGPVEAPAHGSAAAGPSDSEEDGASDHKGPGTETA